MIQHEPTKTTINLCKGSHTGRDVAQLLQKYHRNSSANIILNAFWQCFDVYVGRMVFAGVSCIALYMNLLYVKFARRVKRVPYISRLWNFKSHRNNQQDANV
jgi:hypothetical protein